MKSKLILALAISLGVFSSCNSDSTEVEFNGIGDIYVRCQTIEDVTQYAPVIYAYGNMSMSKATVAHSSADSPVITLKKEDALNFALLPTTEDYSATDVKNGTYNFTLTSTDGEVLNLTDKLLEVRISPLEISKFEYTKENHKLDIEWGTVENRDIYQVKIATKIDGEIIFNSGRLNDNSFTITPETYGWNINYTRKTGTTYTISVSAYKFENPNTQSGYHINQESVAYREIEW